MAGIISPLCSESQKRKGQRKGTATITCDVDVDVDFCHKVLSSLYSEL